MILPIVMAGGSGSRLWPMSRELNPKQFLSLADEHTMLQVTVERLSGLTDLKPQIICNEAHRFVAAEQMRQLGFDDCELLLEPVARNTAAAITLAALKAVQDGQDPLLLVLAADHLISDAEVFQQCVRSALPLAQAGKLVTFGIQPLSPETGYGYIEQGPAVGSGYAIARFVEKPDLATAQRYLASKKFLWNSGMFLFKASRLLDEVKAFAPQIHACCAEALEQSSRDLHFTRVGAEAFARCPSDSIDYAVMEKTADAVVVPMNAGWNDIGSWSALWDVGQKDESGNVVSGDVMADEVEHSYIKSTSRLVAAVGVRDLIIVETKDALLVAHKDKVQGVKKIVENLKAQQRQEFHCNSEVYRPWGSYEAIDQGHRYQVKRITVKPGAKLSVQMHHHRAEHWIVVSGTAKVTNGKETYLVTENQSTYIPIGQVHALENPGKVPLELIEVQSGSYLGEDDIVRFEDIYGRA
ncbi:mannose-1-phosphate guanylyltransferase/mannose-6-phosphate isomerase [Pseudomonas sp. NPDC087612]|uniref:mannose-1-phosphate guanylyltransferase/mannose-6-phosphate isomerase n=1 Tax=unclassified Pseudomonas TaxID=196821 RepID=UPI0005EAD94F|nr:MULTISPECIES: mannose-1-phosphate guanylyltransferase/mannose-6-phosphate isomerase [unclassified Pseudomonas]KJK19544.1 mannose-1-phosphate guanyltransferase [Pseudomonas sp. 2(2015)]QPG63138.1 mannose-1-phosphate guanylyltransferase/mannose-6-phosphate isomerase [Pseudomonas sp. BIGb0427]QVM98089.1 mannose-1-phosphate guanylyltransferase/mannose-6-phosphate isomerase [Pseudomonas sp. SORT22]UVM65585.1 mannose-1-phosphate guanylyltransferase/mannose-6-phosphate isomerase [Pseudomonas sp. B2